MSEHNPRVADGTYVRVFVRELKAGDVTPFGETVESVIHYGDRTVATMTSGHRSVYGQPYTTTLIMGKPIIHPSQR